MFRPLKNILLSTALTFVSVLVVDARTSYEEVSVSPDNAAGLYRLYPVTESVNTAPPKGYKPFYISHYGRHGSRYLVGDEQYSKPLAVFEAADKVGVLTDAGKDVKRRLAVIWADVKGRSGELTARGVKQHHDIAQRMYRAYPEVFAGNPVISARSTTVMRCAHSMAAFCEGLKELKPSLNIPRESSQRYMKYMANVSPRANEFNRWDGDASKRSAAFEAEVTRPERLMAELFADTAYLTANKIDTKDLMRNLFRIATDAPNTMCDVRLDDLFTPDERFALWQSYNYHYYNHMSNPTSANGAVLSSAVPLLANIVESADAAIASGVNGADLRFGHDSCLVPLVGLMKLDGCYGSSDDPATLHEVYADFKISPMAANLQIVFFRNKKGDIIAKLMLNEREITIPDLPTDIGPFYRWDDLRTYFKSIIAEQ